MGQALYRKYRSKSLDDVIGQRHITDTLSKALKGGKISHAYLFTGPRGVGKTSVARILAHEINGLPYDDDSSHIDIIEIDAASNRRIDEIRDLRDRVYVAPTSAKYKVYIIDEVHMLTREAFNALLKTLEEPPAHVVFILATTDAHKVPATIISRTQRFSFKSADVRDIAQLLHTIAKKEKLSVSEDALSLIAEHADGSFRDSVGLLDQASGQSSEVSADVVRDLLGLPPAETITRLLTNISTTDINAAVVMQDLSSLYDQGYQPALIAKQLAALLRDSLQSNSSTLSTTDSLKLLEKLIEVPVSHNPERFLEIVLLQALKQPQPSSESQARSEPISPRTPSATIPELATDTVAKPVVEIASSRPPTKSTTTKRTFDESVWSELLGVLKKKHNTLYSVVRMAQPTFSSPNELELSFNFAFHQKRINESRNKQLLSNLIHELSGQTVNITCSLDNSQVKPKVSKSISQSEIMEIIKEPTTENPLDTISNIFGGAELLES